MKFSQKQFKLLLRLAVSVFLCWWLLKNISIVNIGSSIQHASIPLLTLSMVLGIACVIVSAIQWKILLAGYGIKVKARILTYLYLIGITFNQFLPTGLGGDVIKIVLLGKMTSKGTYAATTVIASRLTGFMGMVCVMVLAALLEFKLFTHETIFIVAVLACAYIGVIAILFNSATVQFVEKITSRFPKLPLGKIHEVQKTISNYQKLPVFLASAVETGAIFWICTILNHYVLGEALGIDISPWFYFVFIPVALTFSMVPISINGFGVREGMFALLFATVHVPSSQAVTLAVVMDAQAIVLAVFGGVLFLMRNRLIPAPAVCSVSSKPKHTQFSEQITIRPRELTHA